MKFDVVIGNPPYLKGKWRDFLATSIELSKDQVSIISPDGTNNFSTRSISLEKLLLDNGIQSKIDCTEYFKGVDSGKIVIYNLSVNKESNKTALDDNSIDGIIVNKIIGDDSSKLDAILSSKRSAKFSKATRFDTSADGLIKNIESITKSLVNYQYIKIEDTTVIDGSKYWLVNRYFGKDSEANIIEENSMVGISSNIMAIKRITNMDVAQFKKIYLSKIIRFVLSILRSGNFDTSPRHIKQLPILDYTKPWTDAELYQHFKLTQEEIDYIEQSVK